jgi:hypothetical protein
MVFEVENCELESRLNVIYNELYILNNHCNVFVAYYTHGFFYTE